MRTGHVEMHLATHNVTWPVVPWAEARERYDIERRRLTTDGATLQSETNHYNLLGLDGATITDRRYTHPQTGEIALLLVCDGDGV